jgi:hypothetical protein
MVAQFEGPHFTVGLHKARFVDVHIECEPADGTFELEPFVDNISQGTIPLSIGGGQAVYGTAVYGTATYAGVGRLKAYTPLPLQAEGRSVWLKTVYTGSDRHRVFTHTIGLVPETVPRQFGE